MRSRVVVVPTTTAGEEGEEGAGEESEGGEGNDRGARREEGHKGGKEGEMEERRRLRKIENDKRYESMMKNEAAREEFKQKTDLKRTELGKEYDV